jgi:hypothetical protein
MAADSRKEQEVYGKVDPVFVFGAIIKSDTTIPHIVIARLVPLNIN